MVSHFQRQVFWRLVLVCAALVGSGELLAHGSVTNEDKEQPLTPTHKQISTFKIKGDYRVVDLAGTPDGLIVALVTSEPKLSIPKQMFGPDRQLEKQGTYSYKIQLFRGIGEFVREWDVDFEGQKVNVSPDGHIYIGGRNYVAKYDTHGKLLQKGDLPQVSAIEELQKSPDFIEQFQKRLDEEQKVVAQQYAMIKKLYDQQWKEKKDSELPPDQQKSKALLEQGLKNLKYNLDHPRTIEEGLATLKRELLRVTSIAVGPQDIFVVCPVNKTSTAHDLWRMSLDFDEPRKLVTGLRGCCGQIDIQVSGDRIYVANQGHSVACYNREGEKKHVIKGKTRGHDQFGGCCNPMNTCLTPSGDILAAESSGRLMRFTQEGEYVGLAGKAEVQGGCRNCAIGMAADGNHIYYLDIVKSEIVVLAKQQPETEATE